MEMQERVLHIYAINHSFSCAAGLLIWLGDHSLVNVNGPCSAHGTVKSGICPVGRATPVSTCPDA